ncbi:MAG TPA: CARDB domain-containing protein, partial [bacterium]|nr:CARDB domain-containing protein [bacterium]
MGKYSKFTLLPILIILLVGTIPFAFSENSEEFYMLTLINKERQGQGLEPLTMNSSLSSAARLHSQDMINRNFFNHVNPDGLTPGDRARNAGYNFIALAENICGNSSIDAGHSSLMGSSSHRVNILNPTYKEVGIGIVDGGPYGKMITQLFGTQSGNIASPPTTVEPQESQELPDLMIQGIDSSEQSEPLKQILMKITLINSGNKNSGSFVFVVFEGSPEKGNQLGKVNIPYLYAGQKITANFSWTPTTEGVYALYFVADYNSDIDEENENNNIGKYTLSVKSSNSQSPPQENIGNTNTSTTSSQNNKPDLYISRNDINYNQTVYENASSLISFRVRNIGKSTAFGVPVKVYVNGDLKVNSTINQIMPSSYTDLNLYLTFTNLGDNFIELRIDPDNNIDEISESNNYINFNIKVVPRENNSIQTQDNNQNNKKTDQGTDLLT